MSQRRNLELHRESLAEIRDIMNAMKTLAYLETRKLTRFQQAQQAIVADLRRTAGDFLGHFPATRLRHLATTDVYLLLGSERGFCGDFNRALPEQLAPAVAAGAVPPAIAVGRKLHAVLPEQFAGAMLIEGPGVAEEVAPALQRIVAGLAELERAHGPLSLHAIYHRSVDRVLMERLLPPFEDLPVPKPSSEPPLIQLPPAQLLVELGDHYLFAALNEMLYSSLMAENQRRMSHLEGAIRHLDETFDDLQRRAGALRQEEIIEEIEVMILSAESLAPAGPQTG